jgi:hypothetical protein
MTGIPYHVQVYVTRGAVARGFFYRRGSEFAVELEQPDGKLVAGGNWPDISAAGRAAEELLDMPTEDPLFRWRSAGNIFLVTEDKGSKQWCIVTIGSDDKFKDTGLRFDTQEEARKLL